MHDPHPVTRNDEFVGYKRQQIKDRFTKRYVEAQRVRNARNAMLVIGAALIAWLALCAWIKFG